jgi:hypothetical protein
MGFGILFCVDAESALRHASERTVLNAEDLPRLASTALADSSSSGADDAQRAGVDQGVCAAADRQASAAAAGTEEAVAAEVSSATTIRGAASSENASRLAQCGSTSLESTLHRSTTRPDSIANDTPGTSLGDDLAKRYDRCAACIGFGICDACNESGAEFSWGHACAALAGSMAAYLEAAHWPTVRSSPGAMLADISPLCP